MYHETQMPPYTATFSKVVILVKLQGQGHKVNKHSECIASNTKSPAGYIF
jgi:hypothetical protein